jgi:hypothetical protein
MQHPLPYYEGPTGDETPGGKDWVQFTEREIGPDDLIQEQEGRQQTTEANH